MADLIIPVYNTSLSDQHETKNSDSPERATNIVERLKKESYYQFRDLDVKDHTFIDKTHDKDYLVWLEEVCKTLNPGQRLACEIFAYDRSTQTKPKSLKAQIGWYCFESTTAITRYTYESSIEAAYCALSAAKSVKEGGSKLSYALCRPPGHHAARGRFGGYCYLNNAAIAANYMVHITTDTNKREKKVAIIDIDYHCGNGTQDIFYEDNDVLFISIHADPNNEELYFWGYEHEQGSGKGTGFNMNIPLSGHVDGKYYLEHMQPAVKKIEDFKADYLIVSFGADTFEMDALGTFRLKIEDYKSIGTALRGLQLPTLVVQEGGYHDKLGESVHHLLLGLSGRDH